MSTIEDRIRAAARAAADTVPPDSVPPLRLPARRPRRSWSFGSAWTRWLAPAGAAVAVVVVALVAVTVGRAGHDSASAPSRAAPRTIASYVAAGLVPRYYVEVNTSGTDAAVRATATGRTLATIAPPTAGDLIVGVSAAADDRTFVVDERPRAGTGALTFCEFRLSSAGRPGTLSRLPVSVPAGGKLTGFALSPTADKLAVAVSPGHNEQDIKAFTLATGAVRTWTAISTGAGFVLNTATFLSWTQDDQTLGVTGDGTETWLINATALSGYLDLDPPTGSMPGFEAGPGPGRFAGSGQGWACTASAVITSDGNTLVCGARVRSSAAVSSDQIGYAEYAFVNGKLEHVLGQRLAGPLGPTLGWVNASGSVLIGGVQANQNSARLTVGVITGYHFVPLPGLPDLSFMNIAW